MRSGVAAQIAEARETASSASDSTHSILTPGSRSPGRSGGRSPARRRSARGMTNSTSSLSSVLSSARKAQPTYSRHASHKRKVPHHSCPFCFGDLDDAHVRKVHAASGCPASHGIFANREVDWSTELRKPERLALKEKRSRERMRAEPQHARRRLSRLREGNQEWLAELGPATNAAGEADAAGGRRRRKSPVTLNKKKVLGAVGAGAGAGAGKKGKGGRRKRSKVRPTDGSLSEGSFSSETGSSYTDSSGSDAARGHKKTPTSSKSKRKPKASRRKVTAVKSKRLKNKKGSLTARSARSVKKIKTKGSLTARASRAKSKKRISSIRSKKKLSSKKKLGSKKGTAASRKGKAKGKDAGAKKKGKRRRRRDSSSSFSSDTLSTGTDTDEERWERRQAAKKRRQAAAKKRQAEEEARERKEQEEREKLEVQRRAQLARQRRHEDREKERRKRDKQLAPYEQKIEELKRQHERVLMVTDRKEPDNQKVEQDLDLAEKLIAKLHIVDSDEEEKDTRNGLGLNRATLPSMLKRHATFEKVQMGKVKRLAADAERDHELSIQHAKEAAMEELVVLRVKYNNIHKRNERAGSPDDDATTRIEEAAVLLAKAEATEKRAAMHTGLDYMMGLVTACKKCDKAVTKAAKALKDRGKLERSKTLRIDRTSATEELREARRKFKTLKITAAEVEDPTIREELDTAATALQRAEDLLTQIERSPDSAHLNSQFVQAVPIASAAVEQAAAVSTRIKRLEELEGRVQGSVDRLATVKVQLDTVIEDADEMGMEVPLELKAELDEAKSAMATADQSVEHCNSSLYSEENADSLHHAVVCAELASQKARNLLDEHRTRWENDAKDRLRAKVEAARDDFARYRAEIMAIHDPDQPANEADLCLVEVEKLLSYVPSDSAASPNASEKFVAAVKKMPEAIRRARIATAGVREARRNRLAAELAEAKAEAEGCMIVYRSQVDALDRKNKEMGSPYDDATHAIDVAKASLLMAEKLQVPAGAPGANMEIMQKFVDAVTKTRDAVEAAGEALKERQERLELEREAALAKDKKDKLTQALAAALTEMSVARHKAHALKVRSQNLPTAKARASTGARVTAAEGQIEAAHTLLEKHQAVPDDTAAAQRFVDFMPRLEVVLAEAEAALVDEEVKVEQAALEELQADLDTQLLRLSGVAKSLQALEAKHKSDSNGRPRSAVNDDAADALSSASKALEAAEIAASRSKALTQAQSKRDSIEALATAVDEASASVDAASLALKAEKSQWQQRQAKMLMDQVSDNRAAHTAAATQLSVTEAAVKAMEANAEGVGAAVAAVDAACKARDKADAAFVKLPPLAELGSEDKRAVAGYTVAVESLQAAVSAAESAVADVHKLAQRRELVDFTHKRAVAVGELRTAATKLSKLTRGHSFTGLPDVGSLVDEAESAVLSAQEMQKTSEQTPESIEYMRRLIDASKQARQAVAKASDAAASSMAVKQQGDWQRAMKDAKRRVTATVAELDEVDGRVRAAPGEIDPEVAGKLSAARALQAKTAAARAEALPEEAAALAAHNKARGALESFLSKAEGKAAFSDDSDDSDTDDETVSSDEGGDLELSDTEDSRSGSAAAPPPDTEGLSEEDANAMREAFEDMQRRRNERKRAAKVKRAEDRRTARNNVKAATRQAIAQRRAARASRAQSKATSRSQQRAALENAETKTAALAEASQVPTNGEAVDRYVSSVGALEEAVERVKNVERSAAVGSQATTLSNARRRLDDLQARNRSVGCPDDEASKAIEDAVTALEKAEGLLARVNAASDDVGAELVTAVQRAAQPLDALVVAAEEAMRERTAKEEELAKDTVLKDGLDTLRQAEAKWEEATTTVKNNSNLLVVPAVRAAYNEATEAMKQARMMRELVVEEDFTGVEDGNGAGGAGAGSAKVLVVPQKIRDQFVHNVQDAMESVTKACEAIALHDNRPEALHAAMSQQRLDAASDLADSQRRLMDSKQRLRTIRTEAKAANASQQLTDLIGSATGAIAEAEASVRTSKATLKRFDTSESAETLLEFVTEVVTACALVNEAFHEVNECETLLNDPTSNVLELRKKRLDGKRNIVNLRQGKSATIIAKLKANNELLSNLVEGQEPGSAVAKAVTGARKAVKAAILAYETFMVKVAEAGDPIPDHKLAGLAALAARANMLATVAGGLVQAATLQERDGNPVTVELPPQATDAVGRLDHARLKLDWLDGKVEEITKNPISAESNRMVREAMTAARDALSNADACHQHVILSAKANKSEENKSERDGCNADGSGPTDERLTALTVGVARAVVLVDGVGYCIDAAAGGASGMSSTLAEEAAMLTKAGKMGGQAMYKKRGRGGALADFSALKGKMDASSIAKRIRRIQLERFAAEFSDLVGRLKDCGTHYKALIEQVRRAKMSSLPRDIGYPLKEALSTATQKLREADLKLPTPEERERNPPTLAQVKEFHEQVRGASIKVYLFERATRAAIEQLAIQDAHEAELVAARQFALANMDKDRSVRAKRRFKASIKAVMMGVRLSRVPPKRTGNRSNDDAKSRYTIREVDEDNQTVRTRRDRDARSTSSSFRDSPGSVRSGGYDDRDRERDRDPRDRDRDRDRRRRRRRRDEDDRRSQRGRRDDDDRRSQRGRRDEDDRRSHRGDREERRGPTGDRVGRLRHRRGSGSSSYSRSRRDGRRRERSERGEHRRYDSGARW